jgi:hypothetical protein
VIVCQIVTGGTDNHLVLVDIKSSPGHLTGSKGNKSYLRRTLNSRFKYVPVHLIAHNLLCNACEHDHFRIANMWRHHGFQLQGIAFFKKSLIPVRSGLLLKFLSSP